MKIIHITDKEEFLGLKGAWNHLVRTTEVDHAFMRHEWFESLIEHLLPRVQLAVHTAWDHDRLVAIAPMHIVRQIRKKLPIKFLSFLTSSVTPRCNFIIDESIDPTPFFDSVFSTKGWDVAEFRSLEVDQPVTRTFIEYLKQGKQYVIEKGLQSPYDSIESDWETYLRGRSRKFRNTYRQSLNRLQSARSYEIISIEDFPGFDKHFDDMVSVSANSWKFEIGTDLKSMPEMAAFFKSFCRLTSKDNLFLSNVLKVNGEPIGFDFYLKFKNRLVVLRWDYDQEQKYYMPGIVLQNHTIKSRLDSGEDLEFDCSGLESKHKMEIVDCLRNHIDITIGNSSPYGRMLMLMKKRFMGSEDLSREF